MTDIQQAFEDVKAAKIEIARLETKGQEYSDKLAAERKALAELEETLGYELETIALQITKARDSLQAGLQRINDAPVEAKFIDPAKCTQTPQSLTAAVIDLLGQGVTITHFPDGVTENKLAFDAETFLITPGVNPLDFDPEEGEGTRGEMRPDDDGALISDAAAAALSRVLQA